MINFERDNVKLLANAYDEYGTSFLTSYIGENILRNLYEDKEHLENIKLLLQNKTKITYEFGGTWRSTLPMIQGMKTLQVFFPFITFEDVKNITGLSMWISTIIYAKTGKRPVNGHNRKIIAIRRKELHEKKHLTQLIDLCCYYKNWRFFFKNQES